MNARRYRTDLRCQSCVATIAPDLDRIAGPGRWEVDLNAPEKTLTAAADPALVSEALGRSGYHVLGEVQTPAPPAEEGEKTTYYPLALVLLFVLGGTAVLQTRAGAFDVMRAMGDFMGLFFVAFAFFKLLDVPAFADAYAGYDVIAARWRGWGYVYPFVELTLGVLYLLRAWSPAVNAATLTLMLVGTAGVVRALLERRKIRCACLGTGFELPMSTVTLVEDAGMAAMALLMLGLA